jgi:3-deoxy-7-phosphoheptulonate synthase
MIAIDLSSAEEVIRLDELISRENLTRFDVKVWGRQLVFLTGQTDQLEDFQNSLDAGAFSHIMIDTESPLSSRTLHPLNSTVRLSERLMMGPESTVFIAGPCAIESESQVDEVACELSAIGVKALRGGAFKPRTSLYSFQGMESQGLEIIRRTADKYKMIVVSEAKDESHVEIVSEYADVVQIGAKSMYSFNLLRKAGESGRAVLVKRGFMTTIKEYLQALDVVLSTGNENVIMCERGIRTFETQTRFTLDLAGAALLQALSHLPMVIDPSHATGRRDLVGSMAFAAAGMGVEGVMIDVHPYPSEALCDREQALTPVEVSSIHSKVSRICESAGRSLI